MCFREKKKEPEIKYREKSFNIGVTLLEIEFQDGRKFLTSVYGIVDQNIYVHEGAVRPPYVIKSLEEAKRQLQNVTHNNHSAFIDDIKNPTQSATGAPIGAKLLETTDYYHTFKEAYLEEVK
jgi:hypothetical protein